MPKLRMRIYIAENMSKMLAISPEKENRTPLSKR